MNKHLLIVAGENITYQTHRNCSVNWLIMEGEGEIVLDDNVRAIHANDTVVIPRGAKLALKAYTDFHIIESDEESL